MAQQLFLPIVPTGATEINDHVSVWRTEERWTYFVGTHPIYWHHATDNRSFLLTVSSLIDSGACRQVDILNAFAVSKSCLDRSVRLYRTEGAAGFFVKRRRGHRSSGHVLTPQILEKCRLLLKEGYSPHQIAEEIEVPYDTLRKAFADGRLVLIESEQEETATTKSSRDLVDAQAASGMGTACTRVEERTLAAFGVCDGAPVRFEACLDVPKGGVLCALPALMMNGLLEGSENLLGKVSGYYRGFHVLLLLAFMALSRIKTAEKFRGVTPGEFGKLLGLDRVPEVRCLRKKMDDMSAGDAAELWAAHLAKHWMAAEPSSVGSLYIDGHVRVYHGDQTKLPRRFVSRDKLCLRGTTDYWVNDAVGRPFFFVEKVSDPGLLNVLREDIVPRLLKDIPNQPSLEELKANPHLCRFVMVFDREGYSPEFFRDMWRDHRIGCITYHKHPRENWPGEWFVKHDVTMPNGERVTLQLAERGSLVGTGKNSIWLREIRKLTESGHQTSIISTYYEAPHTRLAAQMFSRWCQENFFRYMMQHFTIDQLAEYGTVDVADTERVINPSWRAQNRTRNSLQNKLRYQRARFTEMEMHPENEADQDRYDKWFNKKAKLFEAIENNEHELKELKINLKATSKHITWGELDKEDQFQRLLPGRKRFIDTVKMIAYRAETAMAGLLISPTVDFAAARTLLQNLFVTEADILPDPEKKVLLVRVHNASRPAANRALQQLMVKLNEAEMKYPGTDLQIVYEIRGDGRGHEHHEGVNNSSER